MTEPFTYYLRVRYQDCDSQHVVFNARYGDYVDLAITEFLKAALPDRDPFDGSFEIQLVRQLIEWKAPFRFDEVVEVRARVIRFGTTSMTVGFELFKPGEASPRVTAEAVYVHVDGKLWTKQPYPADARRMLETGAVGKTVDHAGYLPRA